MPAFKLTVPADLYEKVSQISGEPFADSYLWGAHLNVKGLHMRTLTGWQAMTGNHAIMSMLKAEGIALPRPTPWPGNGDLMSSVEVGGGIETKRGKGRRD